MDSPVNSPSPQEWSEPERLEDATRVALKMEQGATTSQGMSAASTSQKRPENSLAPRVLEGTNFMAR